MEKDSNKTETPEVGLIGMSHKTAPVDIREQFAFTDEEITEYMDRLHEQGIEETVCVSTCNRVEIYFASSHVQEAAELIMKLLEEKSQISRKKFEKLIYKKYSKDAINHAMMVSASLDSLVVGEDEILGQMKDAYRKSAVEKRTGQVLNRLFHTAFKTAKKIRTETEIARNPLSVAYIATELAMKVFEDISKRKALLIGAGEMGELILKYLTKYNISEIYLANRSFHNAEKIAQEINRDAHIIPLEDIPGVAGKVDIIISSVSVPEYIVNTEMGKEVARDRGDQPLFMIDISIPRSLDPGLSKMDNIFLYNVDDLQTIADENLKNRLKEVELARQLIESDVDEFYLWYEGLVVVPAIIGIQDKFDEIRRGELEKYRKRKLKHLSDEDFKLIEDLTNQIMTKTLHNPIMFLRSFNAADEKDKETIRENVKIIEDLFRMRA
jgi:glutamyl-tRNA reductase